MKNLKKIRFLFIKIRKIRKKIRKNNVKKIIKNPKILINMIRKIRKNLINKMAHEDCRRRVDFKFWCNVSLG